MFEFNLSNTTVPAAPKQTVPKKKAELFRPTEMAVQAPSSKTKGRFQLSMEAVTALGLDLSLPRGAQKIGVNVVSEGEGKGVYLANVTGVADTGYNLSGQGSFPAKPLTHVLANMFGANPEDVNDFSAVAVEAAVKCIKITGLLSSAAPTAEKAPAVVTPTPTATVVTEEAPVIEEEEVVEEEATSEVETIVKEEEVAPTTNEEVAEEEDDDDEW